jgi:SAM-dependent methyltransferase
MSDDLRIGILIVAYNAASTLRQVLDRIPEGFRSRVEKVYVCDDFSTDDTYLIGLGYSQSRDDLPITMVRQPRNLGYGGNQKSGYRMAIDDGMDVVVLLHGDGQYAPEKLPDMVAPFETASARRGLWQPHDDQGRGAEGRMPKYKYVGNKILSRFENSMLGTNLSEFHSGYRAYSTKALASIDFESNSDDFDFDTEIIIQLVEAGLRIKEIPIPTYYGDEICRVNGMRYAADVATDVVTWRLNKMGFGQGRFADVGVEYDLKPAPDSSHGVMLRWLDSMPASKVLDLGCSGGHFAEAARAGEHRVTGVDVATAPGVEDRVDRFIQSDLDSGMDQSLRTELGEERFDVVVLGDVLEHVRQPGRLLGRCPWGVGARRIDADLGAQLRSLVSPHPHRRRGFRLRHAGHPRPHPRAILHQAQLHPHADRCQAAGGALRPGWPAVERPGRAGRRRGADRCKPGHAGPCRGRHDPGMAHHVRLPVRGQGGAHLTGVSRGRPPPAACRPASPVSCSPAPEDC